jgi:putative endopeptidase
MKKRHKFALRLLELDPHPIGKYRANQSLNNNNDFYKIYNIKPKDGMYKNPSKRVHLW